MKIYTNNPGGRGAVIECSLQELEIIKRGLRRVCSEEFAKSGGQWGDYPPTGRYVTGLSMEDMVISYLLEAEKSKSSTTKKAKVIDG